MGTVLDFGTPWHTVYPCHSVAGIYWYISKVIRILNIFLSFFSIKLIMSHCDATKYGFASHMYFHAVSSLPPPLHVHPLPASK